MAEPASEVAPAGQLDPPEAAKQPHWHQAQVQQKQREREQQQVRQHKEQHQQQVTMAAAIGKQDQEVAGVVEDRPFAQSALYQENRLQHGHSQVWGSWFDNSQQRWGYGCCRSVERAERCALAGDASAEVHPTADAVDAVSTESLEELPPRSSFSEPEIFVVRWVRAVLHEWRQRLEDQSGTALALGKRFASAAQLEEAERAIAPLIQLLEANSASFWRGEAVHIWSVGHKRWMTEAKVSQVVKANAVNGDSRHPAGSVLVAFAQDEDSERKGRKWVTPPHFETLLRKAHKEKEKLEKEDDVVPEIGSQAHNSKQLDPVLAKFWAKQQEREEKGESDIGEIGSAADKSVKLDPVLAKRWSQQQEREKKDWSEIGETGSAADKSLKIDPELAKLREKLISDKC
ncbi:unnamed protein product, partial [Polarella glacialis]